MKSNMNCEDFGQDVQEYLNGQLAVDRRESLEAHADGCPACGQVLAEFHRLAAGLGRLEEQVPAGLVGRIGRRVPSAIPGRFVRLRLLVPVAAAAALFCWVAAGILAPVPPPVENPTVVKAEAFSRNLNAMQDFFSTNLNQVSAVAEAPDEAFRRLAGNPGELLNDLLPADFLRPGRSGVPPSRTPGGKRS